MGAITSTGENISLRIDGHGIRVPRAAANALAKRHLAWGCILTTTNQIADERGASLSITETITDDREITVGADLAALQRDLQPVDCRDARMGDAERRAG